MKNNRKIFLLKLIIHLGAFLPIFNLYYQAYFDLLGADPVENVIHFTGIGAFNLLLISLLVSPLAKELKQGFLLQVRRLLGLYAFLYALLHLLNFLAFDIQFDGILFINEILSKLSFSSEDIVDSLNDDVKLLNFNLSYCGLVSCSIREIFSNSLSESFS